MIPGDKGEIYEYLDQAGLGMDVLVGFANPEEIVDIVQADDWEEVTNLDLKPGLLNELEARLSRNLNEEKRKELFRPSTDQSTDHPNDQLFGSWNTSTATEKNLKLNQKQKDLIEKEFSGPGLINGVPGSGKTTIAVHRVHRNYMQDSESGQKQLFITYTNSLINGCQELFGKLWEGEDRKLPDSVEFKTLNGWCAQFVKNAQNRNDLPIIYSKTRKKYIQQSVSEIERTRDSRLFDRDYQFWNDEIKEVIYGMAEGEKEKYYDVDRIGRGSALGRKARETVWKVFQAYRRRVDEKNLLDHNDVLIQARKAIDESDEIPEYQQIVVDEAQDLTVLKLNVLTDLAQAVDAPLILFADAAQSIYQHGFTWKDSGYEITPGNVHKLENNYRTPEPILKAARHLLPDEESNQRPSKSTKAGKKPELIWTGGRKRAHMRVVSEEILELLDKTKTKLSDIAVLGTRKRDLKYAKNDFVEPKGIECSLYKDHLELDESSVKFITIQSAKGLQFDHVFVIRVDRDRYPDDVWDRLDIDDETMESKSRKLLYVAMTRAMKSVKLLSRKPYKSPYLDDLEEYCDVIDRSDV